MGIQGEFNNGLLGMSIVANGAATARISSDMSGLRNDIGFIGSKVADAIEEFSYCHYNLNRPLRYGDPDDELMMLEQDLNKLEYQMDVLQYEIKAFGDNQIDCREQQAELDRIKVQSSALRSKYLHDAEIRKKQLEAEREEKLKLQAVREAEEKRKQEELKKAEEEAAAQRSLTIGAWVIFGLLAVLAVIICICSSI